MHSEHFAGEADAPQLETASRLCENCGGQVFLVDEEGKLGPSSRSRFQGKHKLGYWPDRHRSSGQGNPSRGSSVAAICARSTEEKINPEVRA
jgi:hypothetical protein